MGIKTGLSRWVCMAAWILSREKIMFLFLCYSNSDPDVIGKRYLQYLVKTGILPRHLRIDKGTETGKMCTIHTYLASKLDRQLDADIENRGFMVEGLRQSYESFLPNPAEISAKDAIEGYGF